MKPLRRSLAVLALCFVVSCTESHPRELDGALEWLPEVLCARWERCGSGAPWGATGCEGWMRARLASSYLPRYEEAISRETARARPDARAQCEERASAACDWVWLASGGGGALGGLAGLAGSGSTSCPDIIEGLVEVGGECVMDEECAGDAHCRQVSCDDGCHGVCEAPLPAGATTCVATFGASREDCADGLTCVSDATGNRCAPLPAIGAPCAEPARPSCALGGSCEEGTCVAVSERDRVLGEACGSATAPCGPGLFCDGTTCVTEPSEAAPCISVDESLGLCGDALVCGAADLCVRHPMEGDPCIPGALGGFCTGLLVCSDETCVRMRANGETCLQWTECISRRCEAGVCAPPLYRSPG